MEDKSGVKSKAGCPKEGRKQTDSSVERTLGEEEPRCMSLVSWCKEEVKIGSETARAHPEKNGIHSSVLDTHVGDSEYKNEVVDCIECCH